jgi:hypothetical protein
MFQMEQKVNGFARVVWKHPTAHLREAGNCESGVHIQETPQNWGCELQQYHETTSREWRNGSLPVVYCAQ